MRLLSSMGDLCLVLSPQNSNMWHMLIGNQSVVTSHVQKSVLLNISGPQIQGLKMDNQK